MDVASPRLARSADRASSGSAAHTLFTLAHKFIALATVPIVDARHPRMAASTPDSHHPSTPSATRGGQSAP
ncbi:hypothetical protein BRC80_10640 [Halobacteriales archaeon QH_9_66_26]|nr:MAG: hypothetical protein BRC80_10640 [Halobacteriales archaeon QH_9_66_26]